MILAGQWADGWEPSPPRPGSFDDCQARGFDPASTEADRARPEPLDESWQQWLDGAVAAAKHRRDEDGDDRCGSRCDTCDERTCQIDGPELRACGVTCVDCPCSCTRCLDARDDLHAEVIRLIERDTRA